MGKEIKINLGCGRDLLEDFINVDIYYDFKDKNYVRSDVRKLPFKDNYADYILAREIIEHIPTIDLISTLKEWIRVLKPGGRLVITCPDFNQMAEEWLNNDFTPDLYYELAQGIYGNQQMDKEYHLSPMTPQFFKYALGSLGRDANISTYPRGHIMKDYPGYKGDPTRAYRFGQIHVIIDK